MGVPSLNDLAVDGTLNTTNQPIYKLAIRETTVTEWIAYWIHTPQDLTLQLMGYGLLSIKILTVCHYNSIKEESCFMRCGRGSDFSVSSEIQDNKMGSSGFQCAVPH